MADEGDDVVDHAVRGGSTSIFTRNRSSVRRASAITATSWTVEVSTETGVSPEERTNRTFTCRVARPSALHWASADAAILPAMTSRTAATFPVLSASNQSDSRQGWRERARPSRLANRQVDVLAVGEDPERHLAALDGLQQLCLLRDAEGSESTNAVHVGIGALVRNQLAAVGITLDGRSWWRSKSPCARTGAGSTEWAASFRPPAHRWLASYPPSAEAVEGPMGRLHLDQAPFLVTVGGQGDAQPARARAVGRGLPAQPRR